MSKLNRIPIIFIFLFGIISVSANTIWTVDAVKTKTGQQINFLKFIEQNWAKARQKLKEHGKVKSYTVLSTKPDKKLLWDVLLITEYADIEIYNNREELFAEVFKNQQLILIDGKRGRDFSKIISSDVSYENPISSEKFANFSNEAERQAVKIPLENYIKGQATGNGDFIRQAFHKDGKINAFRDGKLLNLTVEEFASRFNGKPAADEDKRKRIIESIEIAGDTAIAKIILDYPTVKFTDYMSLLKIDGEWKIINKTFYAEVKK
jgi:hypothetical protein